MIITIYFHSNLLINLSKCTQCRNVSKAERILILHLVEWNKLPFKIIDYIYKDPQSSDNTVNSIVSMVKMYRPQQLDFSHFLL